MTTSDDRTFFSTGTVMADGAGGAVRAATSAGERMRLAAPQLTSEERITAPSPTVRARFLRMTPPPADPRDPSRNSMTNGPPPPHRAEESSAKPPARGPKIISQPPLTPWRLRKPLRQESGAIWAN